MIEELRREIETDEVTCAVYSHGQRAGMPERDTLIMMVRELVNAKRVLTDRLVSMTMQQIDSINAALSDWEKGGRVIIDPPKVKLYVQKKENPAD
jgi:hypothetical protein